MGIKGRVSNVRRCLKIRHRRNVMSKIVVGCRFFPVLILTWFYISNSEIVFSGTFAVYSAQSGECTLTVESSDLADTYRTLRLRVLPQTSTCHIEKDSMVAVIRAAFAKSDPPRLEGTYTSFYIGRLIDYPWLSQHLAVTAYGDAKWDKKKGKPVGTGANKYVSGVLSDKKITAQMEEALAEPGYNVVSATVEKVLVGSLCEVPLYKGKVVPAKVPYDAMVWFRLTRKQGSE